MVNSFLFRFNRVKKIAIMNCTYNINFLPHKFYIENIRSMKNINSKWHSNYDFIYDIPPLVLSYSHGVFTGSFKPGVSSYELHFEDVCSFLGHVCLCGAGGYKIAQLALENLKNDSPILEKDMFTLVSSRDHTISDVVAFILGYSRRNDLQKNQYFIDDNIKANKREYHYQIAYHPNKKAVHIIYRKHLLIGNEQMDKLWKIELVLDKEPNSVSESDKKLYRDTMVSIVKDVLWDRKAGLFEVQNISYPFFEKDLELMKMDI